MLNRERCLIVREVFAKERSLIKRDALKREVPNRGRCLIEEGCLIKRGA